MSAAENLFARFGFQRASMSQIAEEAGLTRQALYHHYTSKEALFRAVVEQLHECAYEAEAVAGLEQEQVGGGLADILAAQIFDPRTGHWTAISAPPGWDGIGDAASCVLPDGRVMLGQFDGNAVALYHPGQNHWTFTSPKGNAGSLRFAGLCQVVWADRATEVR